MENKLMFIDNETGGFDERNQSLLTIGLAFWKDGKIVATEELGIAKEKYQVCEQALEVNHINLEQLRKQGMPSLEVIKRVEKFCKNSFGDEKVVFAGHNVGFDLKFLRQFYYENGYSNETYEEKYSYRSVDTASIIKYLYLAGVLKEDVSSSSKAFEYFHIDFAEGARHTAIGDCIATAELFNKLISLIEKR